MSCPPSTPSPSCRLPAPPTPAVSTLSLHDALPIWQRALHQRGRVELEELRCNRQLIGLSPLRVQFAGKADRNAIERHACARSEEHTSELQSLRHLVCRLLLEKKN